MSALPLPATRPPAGPARAPQSPFLWGRGGQRLTQDEIDIQRRLAAQQLAEASSTAPVSHWLQGAARALGGLTGGLQMRRADRAASERQDAQQTIIESLLKGDKPEGGIDPVAAALADPELRSFGMEAWKARQPKAIEPVIKQMNNGDYVGLNPMTGEVMFTQKDPNPRPVLDWQKVDNGDGTFTFMPFDANGPVAGGTSGPIMPSAPVGKLTPITDGGPAPAPGSFPGGR